jgi:hypothetical protein
MRTIAMIAMFAYGCAGTFEVTGGPTSVRMQLSKAHILDNVGMLVAGDPEAANRISEIRTRERIAKGLLVAEGISLAGCIISNSNTSTQFASPSIGLCVATIVFGIGVLIVNPRQRHYGDPLRIYNRNHPQTRYVAPALDVN